MKKRFFALLVSVCLLVTSYLIFVPVESEAAGPSLSPIFNVDYRRNKKGDLSGNWDSSSTSYIKLASQDNVYYAVRDTSTATEDKNIAYYNNNSTSNYTGQWFSLELYFRYSTNGEIAAFKQYKSSDENGNKTRWFFVGVTGGKLCFCWNNSSTYYAAGNSNLQDYISTSITLTDNTWYHLVVVFDTTNYVVQTLKLNNTNQKSNITYKYNNSNKASRWIDTLKNWGKVYNSDNSLNDRARFGAKTNRCRFIRVYKVDISDYIANLYYNKDNYTAGTTYNYSSSSAFTYNTTSLAPGGLATVSSMTYPDPLATYTFTCTGVGSINGSSGAVTANNPTAAGTIVASRNQIYDGKTATKSVNISVSATMYTIYWKNWDGTGLKTDTVAMGTTPVYNGTPQRAGNAQYRYTFTGWSPTVSTVNGNATYTAQFRQDVNTYTVTWKNYNGTTLETDTGVAYGTNPTYNSGTPTKPEDVQNTYTFSGWSPAVSQVQGNVTYTAQFTPVTKKYKITFINGTEELYTPSVNYGSNPVYSGATPTRAEDDQYTYLFDGWITNSAIADSTNPSITPLPSPLPSVEGIASYYAHFSPTTKTYTYTFYDYDGTTVLKTDTIPYGDTIVLPEDPTREPTNTEVYSFDKWVDSNGDPVSISTISGNVDFYASYTTGTRYYTITWLDDDNSPLTTTSEEYGATPSYPFSDPTKTADNTYTYSFSGWTPSIETVTEDTSYTAVYDSEYIVYIIQATSILQDNTSAARVVPISVVGDRYYGNTITLTASLPENYEFIKWQVSADGTNWSDATGSGSTSASYSVTVNGDAYYRAVVRSLGAFILKVEAPEFTINENPGMNHGTAFFDGGTNVTVDYTTDSYTFKYWRNGADKIVHTSENGTAYTFYITSNVTLKAEYADETVSKESYVIYVSAYDQILESYSLSSSEAGSRAQPSSGPSKLGYRFLRWDKTPSEIAALIDQNTEKTIIVYPVYEKINESNELRVQYKTASDDTIANDFVLTIELGKNKSITAPNIENHTFSYWMIGEEIVSYGETYRIRPLKDTTIIAIYDYSGDVTAVPIVSITGKTATDMGGGKYKISFTATRTVPEGFTLIKQGVILTSKSSIANGDDFTLDNTSTGVKVYEGNNTEANGNTTANVNVTKPGTVIYVRGYVTYKDSNNVLHTVYSQIDSASYSSLTA